MSLQFSGLWRHRNFMRLWVGQAISVMGSMVGVFALNLTAVLLLHATPLQLGWLGAARFVPGVIIILLAGAWVDSMERRPVLIAADLGRAFILASIPLAVLLYSLHMEHLYIAMFLVSILTLFFNVAYESYLFLPARKQDLLERNSKLSASASLAETGRFSIAGWLVHLFSASFGIWLDAVSFILSALFIGFIPWKKESKPAVKQQTIGGEIVAGLKTVWHNPLLRASAISTMILELSWGINGVFIVLYVIKGLGFQLGILGMIWVVGGGSSLLAAVLAERVTKYFGIGPVMVLSLLLAGISMTFIQLARGATIASALLLIASQLFGDGAVMLYGINKVSLQQSLAPRGTLGRVNASMQFAGTIATLIGSIIGGLLGEMVGIRSTLFIGAGGILASMCWLACSPVRRLHAIQAPALEPAASSQ